MRNFFAGLKELFTTPQFYQILLLVVIVSLGLFRGALVSDESAIRALDDAGFSHVVVQEKAYFAIGIRGGSKGDAARFTCRATNPAGKEVTIYVFVGWPFKGATVRSL
mgnify:CR=1 FL=1